MTYNRRQNDPNTFYFVNDFYACSTTAKNRAFQLLYELEYAWRRKIVLLKFFIFFYIKCTDVFKIIILTRSEKREKRCHKKCARKIQQIARDRALSDADNLDVRNLTQLCVISPLFLFHRVNIGRI